jgi:hypothetical protein
MKKILFSILLTASCSISMMAQDEVSAEAKVKDKPVRPGFQSGMLIDNQTTYVSSPKTLEMDIQHKFGKMDKGFSDLFGIYSPGANIRLGFSYTPIKNLQVGYGIAKQNMYNDFSAKYVVFEQTRNNTFPVALALYGNLAINGTDTTGTDKLNFYGVNRLSYFGQVIISRKFNDWCSVQLNGSFSHFNAIDSLYDHDKLSVGINAKFQFSPQSSILVEYDMPLKIQGIAENHDFFNPAKPNLGIAWEISTSTHTFQIFVSTADGLLPQHNAMFNQNDFTKGDLMFGFTIARLWSF